MRIAKIKSLFNDFWFAPSDARPLAYFRIFMGVIFIFLYLALIPHWNHYFGPEGFKYEPPGFVNMFGWFDFLPTFALWWLGFLAALTFTLGLFTRTSTLILFLLQAAMIQTNRMTVNGEDLVLRFLLFYSLFACLNGALSVDSWWRRRRGRAPASGTMWPIRLLQVNTALIYAFSLPIKLASDISWLTGDFMYYTLVNSTWSRFPFPALTYHWWFVAPMTYASILAEAFFVLFAWHGRTRLPIVLTLAFFHASIAVILQNVTFFSLAMIAAFFAFLREEDWTRLRRWAGRVREFLSKLTRNIEMGQAPDVKETKGPS